MARIKRNRIEIWISLSDEELATFEKEREKRGFSNKATFMKWITMQFIRQAQVDPKLTLKVMQ